MTAQVGAERIDALLPQTQCGQCGFDGCMPYAQALARGETTIDRCPPGGQKGADALARLLNVAPRPLDPACGTPRPVPEYARIIESLCIGCTRCIQACPVDAIMGAAKRMHTVITQECTGCELCVPPCPVDCIVMEPAPDRAAESASIRQGRRDLARARYRARGQRLAAASEARRNARADADQRRRQAGESPMAQIMARVRQKTHGAAPATQSRPPAVAAAIARARNQRAASSKDSGQDQ